MCVSSLGSTERQDWLYIGVPCDNTDKVADHLALVGVAHRDALAGQGLGRAASDVHRAWTHREQAGH